jgi:hypothetical protein
MMDAANTPETSINFYQSTQLNKPEATFKLAAART